ncbi:lipid droplet phospholipase 1-like isoform X3 [Diospyros lotus]|uniref:lipid droplet phospholipase 1-like isoform X3 n=1 Tax=Diospyros lotus TaxID=55363 RepID=UPI00224EDBA5|nr:lipid droplet phospholipase 1-like isoform X3 [Diospyros lotus]
MEIGAVEKGVCSSESVNGGQDFWSCGESDASSADHLVVMVHGIMGSAADWKFASEQFIRILPDKVFVHCSERNTAKLTLDGVDVMGERLTQEVLELIKQRPNLRKISFVAHSVGGLVARYAIGRLFRPPKKEIVEDLSLKSREEEFKGTIGGLEPMNFITVATPHLGSRGNKQVPFLLGVPVFEKAASLVIHLIFRRTGRHLFLTDDDDTKPPLLKRMLGDYGECCFMSALGSFKRRVAYSNVGHDSILLIVDGAALIFIHDFYSYVFLLQDAIQILWAGEHHQLGVIMNFLRGTCDWLVSCIMGESRRQFS